MSVPAYAVKDALLHVAAGVERLSTEVTQWRDHAPDALSRTDFANAVLAALGGLQQMLAEHQVVHGAHGECYTTGIPVASIVEVADGARWEKVWHPNPAHHTSRRRILAEGVPLAGGVAADIIVTAPGQLDVVRKPGGGG
jgi:hypothetical protein